MVERQTGRMHERALDTGENPAVTTTERIAA